MNGELKLTLEETDDYLPTEARLAVSAGEKVENISLNIGKHKIVTENADEIAEITRDPGTNVFRVTAKKVGTVEVEFENSVYWRIGQPGDAFSGITNGMKITVQEMNGLVNISASQIYEINSDM